METPTLCSSLNNTIRPTQISTFPFHHSGSSTTSLKLRQPLRWQKGGGLAMQCGHGGDDQMMTSSAVNGKEEIDREEYSGDDEREEEEEEVELMEMEAIMGKDDGKQPMDYKRRAGIFYKSSEVFQANKDQPHHCTST